MTGPLGRLQQDQTTPSTAVMILPTAARALVADATNNSNPARRDDSPDASLNDRSANIGVPTMTAPEHERPGQRVEERARVGAGVQRGGDVVG